MSTMNKQARVAVVMPRLSRYGGAEGFAYRLAEALAAQGREVDFICARCETEPPEGVNPVVVGRFGPFRFLKVLWFAWAADRACRKGDYDLVFGLGKTVNQDILRVGGGPVSVFNKVSIRAWPEGFPRTFKALRRKLAPANWAIAAIDRKRFRPGRTIIAVSHLVRDWILEANPALDPEAVRVIYNRPDLERFSPVSDAEREALREQAGVKPDQVLITTAGTNFQLKGIAQLIKALALLSENHVLHVAGGRNPAKYKRLAASLGVEDRVRFLGRVENMPEFYRTGDLFVLATFYDACSNAVLEALACGSRVISGRNNGSTYFLPPESVVDPGDHEALARAIIARLETPPPTSFVWPEEEEAGLEPYLRLIAEMLQENK